MNKQQAARQKQLAGNISLVDYRTELKFICDSDYHELTEVLMRLAPECDICQSPKMYFCLECPNNAMLCWSCDRDQHLFHKLNQLQMLFLIPVPRGSISMMAWQSKERLLDQIIAELSNVRSMKMRNRWKNNYERRTLELNIIDGLLNYAKSERKEISSRFIDGLRELLTRTLLANRKRTQGTQISENEWSRSRKEFLRFCQQMSFKPIQRAKPIGLDVVCELERTIKQGAGATPMIGELFEQYLSNYEQLLLKASMDSFVGKEWLRVNLHITPNRPACLSREQASCWGNSLPKRLILGSDNYGYYNSLTGQSTEPRKAFFELGNIEEISLFESSLSLGRLPPHLKAISLSISQLGCDFPVSLRKITLDMSAESAKPIMLQNALQSMLRLTHLRELNLYFSSLYDLKMLSIVFMFAISMENSLRAMFLDFKLNYYSSNQPSNQVTELKGHYTAYRRTLVQGMLLMKSRRIRGLYWADSILDQLELPIKIEKPMPIKTTGRSIYDLLIYY